MLLLGTYRRREVVGAVDVAHHARVADRNLDECALVGGEQVLGALIAANESVLVKIPVGDPGVIRDIDRPEDLLPPLRV